MIVAIDGPAGAGKSTVSARVARALGFQLVSTGALYRAVAHRALEAGVAFDDDAGLGALAEGLDVRFSLVGDVNRVFVDGEDVTDALRTPEVSNAASLVSSAPSVRGALLAVQRELGERFDVVMEGRDIGTVIFPNADVKVFLTATAEERARRRLADFEAAGEATRFEDVLADVVERDRRDTERAIAPLREADDAVRVDATSVEIDAVVAAIVGLAEARR